MHNQSIFYRTSTVTWIKAFYLVKYKRSHIKYPNIYQNHSSKIKSHVSSRIKTVTNFCIPSYWNNVKENNSITIDKHVLNNHWPHYSKPPLVFSCRSKVGQTTVQKVTVETLVLDQCWAIVSKPTMTCCQQLQQYPTLAQQLVSI